MYYSYPIFVGVKGFIKGDVNNRLIKKTARDSKQIILLNDKSKIPAEIICPDCFSENVEPLKKSDFDEDELRINLANPIIKLMCRICGRRFEKEKGIKMANLIKEFRMEQIILKKCK